MSYFANIYIFVSYFHSLCDWDGTILLDNQGKEVRGDPQQVQV